MQLERISYLQQNIDFLLKDNKELSYVAIHLKVAETLKRFLQRTKGRTEHSIIHLSPDSKMISEIRKEQIERRIFDRIRKERNTIAHPTPEVPDLSNSPQEIRDIYSFIQKNS